MVWNVTQPALTGAPLDRADHLRADADAIAALRAAPEARVVVFSMGNPMLRGGAGLAFLRPDHPLVRGVETVFLGLDGTAPVFAVGLGEVTPPDGAEFVEMRASLLGGAFSGDEASIAAIGKSVVSWHRSHRHCARCGAQSTMSNAGWRRDCGACGAQHFPRTDPVVIMLIERGEYCAIARNVNFPDRLYSCIAGFVEPGESVEDAVRRETLEELGLRVERVAYVSSQPWPFPSSLMLGCIAETLDEAFTLEAAEIADARWFSRDDVRDIFAETHPDVAPPRKAAIARTLLKDWMHGRIGFG